MNPTDHDGRISSPFVEHMESADMGPEVFVHPASYVSAADAAREVGPMPIRHRAGKDTWGALAASAVGAAVLIVGALAIGGAF